MRGLSRRTFGGMLAAAAPGSALPAPRAPALIRPPWAPPAWTGWQQVPGGGSTIDAPSVSFNSTYLYVVVRGLDDGIYYNIIQLSPLSPWSGWRQVPDGATPNAPSVAAYDEDSLYLDVFVRDEDNGIQSNTFDLLKNSWSGWSVIPGRGLTPSAPAADFRGYPNLVVRDTNDGIQWNVLDWDTNSWSGWSVIPGRGLTPSAPAAATGFGAEHGGSGPTTETVVVRGLDNRVYQNINYFYLNGGKPAWTGWSEVPGGMLTPSGPAVMAVNPPANPQLVVRGLDGGVYYNFRNAGRPRRGAPLWTEIPGGARTPSAPGVVDAYVRDYDRRRYVFIRGVDNLIYFNSYQY